MWATSAAPRDTPDPPPFPPRPPPPILCPQRWIRADNGMFSDGRKALFHVGVGALEPRHGLCPNVPDPLSLFPSSPRKRGSVLSAWRFGVHRQQMLNARRRGGDVPWVLLPRINTARRGEPLPKHVSGEIYASLHPAAPPDIRQCAQWKGKWRMKRLEETAIEMNAGHVHCVTKKDECVWK